MSRSIPPIFAPLLASLLAMPIALPADALADDEPAVEDQWWQADGRERTGYFEAGVEVTVDDGNVEGEVGEAGNVELTTGFWWVPFAAAEVQVAVGQAVNPGVLSDTRVASTHGGIGAGIRLGLPIRISPVLAAHVGYRQVLGATATLTCGADCANRSALAIDHAPDQLFFVDTEAGLQVNIGVFSMSATFEYATPLAEGDTGSAQLRGNPDANTASPTPAGSDSEMAVNLQAGVRF